MILRSCCNSKRQEMIQLRCNPYIWSNDAKKCQRESESICASRCTQSNIFFLPFSAYSDLTYTVITSQEVISATGLVYSPGLLSGGHIISATGLVYIYIVLVFYQEAISHPSPACYILPEQCMN